MARKIPENFDFRSINLDDLETKVRDILNVNIENWAKFRYTITASVNSNTLKSRETIPNEVKSSYIELSKSHYEVVTMLGAVSLSIINMESSINIEHLDFKKAFKEFYIHSGAVLDNLSRLIYIVNIPNAPFERGRFGLLRHEIGYGGLASIQKNYPTHLKGYNRIIKNRTINEIKNIRNNFAHSWPPAMFIKQETNEYYWPVAMRRREQYYLWPHDPDEIRRIKREYRKKVPILEMVKNDFIELERFQNYVFKKITEDIKKFERNHNLKISG